MEVYLTVHDSMNWFPKILLIFGGQKFKIALELGMSRGYR